MKIALIILYVSMFVFLFPPIRQYKGQYFYFFLALALEDPIARLLIGTIGIYQIKVHIIFSILLIYSVLNIKKMRFYILFGIPILIIAIIGLLFVDLSNKENFSSLRVIIGFIHIGIFFIFVKKAIILLRDNLSINLFQLMLILYESSIILKFFIFVLSIKQGILFFFITSAFELLLGLFFAFYREENPKLTFHIKEIPE